MTENTIIEFTQNGTTALGLLLKYGSKCNIKDAKGRELTIAQKNILYNFPGNVSIFENALKELQFEIQEISTEIDVELLYQSVKENEEYEVQALANIYFSSKESKYCSALRKKLNSDALYFKPKGDLFQARTRVQIEAIQTTREKTIEKEKLNAIAIDELRNLLGGNLMNMQRDEVQLLLKHVESWFFKGAPSSTKEQLEESHPGFPPLETAYTILINSKILPPSTDYFIASKGVDVRFKPEEIHYAASLPELDLSSREMVSANHCFSIDDSDTREIDDLLSIQFSEQGTTIGIHIADLAAFLHHDDPLDNTAYHRTSSLYTPTGTVYMLPEVLSCEKASLNPGALRPALSLFVQFDDSNTIISSRFCRTAIFNEEKLDYNSIDPILFKKENFPPQRESLQKALETMYQFSLQLKKVRKERGALFINKPEIKIKVDKIITTELIDFDSPSRAMIAEYMILYNQFAAEFAKKNNIPFIFRSQEAPEQVPIEFQNDGPYQPVVLKKLFSTLKKSKTSIEPEPHHGLGIEMYSQVSSPLRRYADLVLQRQIISYLENTPLPATAQKLQEIIAIVDVNSKEQKKLENDSKRYWTLTLLEKNRIQIPDFHYTGIVLEQISSGYIVELEDFMTRGVLRSDREHEEGEFITCTITHINFKKDYLELSESDNFHDDELKIALEATF